MLSDIVFPSINFTSQTPANATTTTNTSVQINISITNASDLAEMKWNWNNTNYTFYNDSLVLMMNFNNVSAIGENSTYAVDVSKYQNNCTLYDNTHWNCTDGKYGCALSFDGSNDYIDCGNDSSLTLTTMTLEGWFKLSVLGETYILSKASAALDDKNYIIYLGSNGALEGDIMDSSGNGQAQAITSAGEIAAGSWYHFAYTYNGTNGKIYVNSALKNTSSAWSGTVGTAREHLYIGQRINQYYFNGLIDEVRINNRSLSAAEINQSYMSNLYKYDVDKWAFYSNQTISEPAINYTYNYSGCAKDISGNENCTEMRALTIQGIAPSINFASPTLDDGANSTSNWIYVNVSVTEVNFANITFLLRNDTTTVNSTTFTTATYTINWTNLSYANYTYNVSIYDTGGNFNSTETRRISLQGNYLIINMTYPANESSLPRGSDTITYEDDAQAVSNNISIMATVYDNSTLAGLQNINCSFYFDSTLIGNAMTNSSGGCNLSYDKSGNSFGWHNISVNYTGLPSGYLKAANESTSQLRIENWTMHVDIENYRAGVQYFSDELAGINITIKRDNSLSNITNLTLVMTDNTNAEFKRFNIENFTQQGTGIYFVETIVPSMNWLRWKAFASFNFSGIVGLINATSSQHTDVIINLGNATLNITAVNNTDVVFENTTIKLYKYGLLDKYKIYEDYANSSQPWVSRAVALYDNDYDVIVDIPDNHTLKLTRLNISSVELKIKIQSANITAPSGITNISKVILAD